MKKFKEWPKWAKWLLCLGLPLTVIISVGLGILFGMFGPALGITKDPKAMAFTYEFKDNFEGYHAGTKVTVRNDGREYFDATSGDNKTVLKGENGYIIFDKNHNPESVKGFDGVTKIVPPHLTWQGQMNNSAKPKKMYGTQKWNPNNIYAVHLDKYI